MDESNILMHTKTAIFLFATLALPPLICAAIVGFVTGILQAATQIQDQTLPQTFKIIVVIGVLFALAPVLIAPLQTFTDHVFSDFPAMTRR